MPYSNADNNAFSQYLISREDERGPGINIRVIVCEDQAPSINNDCLRDG